MLQDNTATQSQQEKSYQTQVLQKRVRKQFLELNKHMPEGEYRYTISRNEQGPRRNEKSITIEDFWDDLDAIIEQGEIWKEIVGVRGPHYVLEWQMTRDRAFHSINGKPREERLFAMLREVYKELTEVRNYHPADLVKSYHYVQAPISERADGESTRRIALNLNRNNKY